MNRIDRPVDHPVDHYFSDGSKNKEVEVLFSGNRRFSVPMPRSRKTSFDLILDPPVPTHKLKITITSVYSQVSRLNKQM